MGTREQLREQFIVRPGEAAGIAARDPGWTGGTAFPDLADDELQQRAMEALARGSAELSEAQELLWASDRYALLIVLQAMDAAGKDSVIKHVMDGVNPQGVQVEHGLVVGLGVGDLVVDGGVEEHRVVGHARPFRTVSRRRQDWSAPVVLGIAQIG